jgi:hypothetical protein
MLSRSSLMAVAGAAALAACSPQADAKSGATPVIDSTHSAAGDVSAKPGAPAATTPAAGTPPAPATTAATPAPTSIAPGDTAGAKLIAGRSKQDYASFASTLRAGAKAMANWPKGPTALSGALLPGNRIVAYYGNPHSKKMGVIGEYPEQEMLGMLDKTVAMWRAADPSTPVIPAIHLVTVIAQGAAGSDGGWRRRETADMIERSYGWAKGRKGLLILDIQGGHSTLQQELPPLLKYLERPDVHLGIDPEFYMHHEKEGVRPSAKIGQMTAEDVNYVIQTLDKLVADKHLPPKILVVHRFTRAMVPDAESIHPTPRVQVVMDMDGWGPAWLKFDSYRDYIVAHPVQFTGIKIFYHNDAKNGAPILTPGEVLRLFPRPLYIQYQ